jgi:CheY-like chemotaxis protein
VRKPKTTKTVLIVDDNENDRIMCERELRNEGSIARSVSSGQEVLQFVETNPHPDLIILDIRMSPFDGMQVLRQLRAKNVFVPVILFSDYPAYRADFNTWLAEAYLVKSSDLTELKQKVKEFLSLG